MLKAIGINSKPYPLEKYYQDEDLFQQLGGVKKEQRDLFLLVTGSETHYLLLKPFIKYCPYHDWDQANRRGIATSSGPIAKRSLQDRSYFVSREELHCAHREVYYAKSSRITDLNSDRCGLRSGDVANAFCEIWRFETHLCCRNCVFEKACIQSEVLRLPCKQLNLKGNIILLFKHIFNC